MAGEYDKRAERFFNAPNGDLAMGSDGLLRWLGAPVASMTAGEDALRPRPVLLADEQLTGPSRDKVQQRAERFVTYQVSTILKPLADLRDAEGVEGTAKGIAYRLFENFGLLQRRDVADEVRGLDQDARAALRRLGVRFGAYHIFMPALVKPAPANLMTLLWGIAHDGRDRPGFGEVTQLLATGRTSVQADPSFDPVFYSLAGYRLLGRRAVRVDILERLADLIRPALAWTPGQNKRPDGAFNGREFLVTPAMMSILGATADDMDEILKGLGYRSQPMDQREVEATFARQDEAAQAAMVPTAAAGGDAASAADGATDAEAGEAVTEDTHAAAGTDEIETAGEPEAGGEAVAEPEPEVAVETAPSESGGASDVPQVVEADAAATVADTASEAAAEAKMVQLWRPHRGERRPAGAGRGAGAARGGRGRGGAEAGTARREDAGEARGPNRGGGRFERRGGEGGGQRSDGERSAPRPGSGKPRHEGGSFGGSGQGEARGRRDNDRAPGKSQGNRDRDGFKSQAPRFEKPKAIDPDSPFAKLAALKDKLGK